MAPLNHQASLSWGKKAPRAGGDVLRFPVPNKGVNAGLPLSLLQPPDAVNIYNMVCAENGLKTRKGYRKWADTLGGEVRTLIPYVGEVSSSNKLFAVTENGIYDITSDGTSSPTAEVTFTTTTGSAGYGVYQQFTNDSGDRDLFYADEENGLFQYDAGAGTWGASSFTGITDADVRFVVTHMSRMWFVLKDDQSIYYSNSGTYSGGLMEFFIGSKLTRGGDVVSAFSWTVDGGDGVQDLFVIVTRGGDVIVYQGTDPSTAANWTLVGQFPLARLPAGRNMGAQAGGELYFVTTNGIVGMSDVIRGVAVDDVYYQGIGARITPLLRGQMDLDQDKNEWGLQYIPAEGFMAITQPTTGRGGVLDDVLFVMNMVTKGWSFLRFEDLDLESMCEHLNSMYFGTAAGDVYIYEGSLDNVDNAGTGGMEISFSLLTSFQDISKAGRFTISSFIRPVFSTEGVLPSYATSPRYDYATNDVIKALTGGSPSGSTWDSGTWDSATWESGDVPDESVRGGGGTGRRMAVALSGTTEGPVTLLEFDVAGIMGGPL